MIGGVTLKQMVFFILQGSISEPGLGLFSWWNNG